MASRDNRRTLEQRNQRAYEQGYRGKGGGVSGAYAAARKARAADQPIPTDRTARPDLRQIINLPNGRRIVTPRGEQTDKVANSQLRGAGRFQVRATVQTSKGPQEVDLFSKGGWKASELRRLIAEHGTLRGAVAWLINNGVGVLNGTGGSLFLGEEVDAEAVSDIELDLA